MEPTTITGLFTLGSALIDRLFPDKTERDAAKLKLFELQQKGDLAAMQAEVQLLTGQMEINREEAKAGPFRGGWRPFIGWVCGSGLAYQYVLRPILEWMVVAYAVANGIVEPAIPPELELKELLSLLAGMLGLGFYRTREKMKGLP